MPTVEEEVISVVASLASSHVSMVPVAKKVVSPKLKVSINRSVYGAQGVFLRSGLNIPRYAGLCDAYRVTDTYLL